MIRFDPDLCHHEAAARGDFDSMFTNNVISRDFRDLPITKLLWQVGLVSSCVW